MLSSQPHEYISDNIGTYFTRSGNSGSILAGASHYPFSSARRDIVPQGKHKAVRMADGASQARCLHFEFHGTQEHPVESQDSCGSLPVGVTDMLRSIRGRTLVTAGIVHPDSCRSHNTHPILQDVVTDRLSSNRFPA